MSFILTVLFFLQVVIKTAQKFNQSCAVTWKQERLGAQIPSCL